MWTFSLPVEACDISRNGFLRQLCSTYRFVIFCGLDVEISVILEHTNLALEHQICIFYRIINVQTISTEHSIIEAFLLRAHLVYA